MRKYRIITNDIAYIVQYKGVLFWHTVGCPVFRYNYEAESFINYLKEQDKLREKERQDSKRKWKVHKIFDS